MLNELIRISCIVTICYAWHIASSNPSRGKGKITGKQADVKTTWTDKILWILFLDGYMAKVPFWLLGIAEIVAIFRKQPTTVQTIMTLRASIGFLLCTFGGLLRQWSADSMGSNFTFVVMIRDNHTLITHGPYAWVRHPGYSAGALLQLGAWIWHTSPGSWMRESVFGQVALAPILVCLYAAFMARLLTLALRRIPLEDRILKEHFGREWEDYAKRVPYRIIPGVF